MQNARAFTVHYTYVCIYIYIHMYISTLVSTVSGGIDVTFSILSLRMQLPRTWKRERVRCELDFCRKRAKPSLYRVAPYVTGRRLLYLLFAHRYPLFVCPAVRFRAREEYEINPFYLNIKSGSWPSWTNKQPHWSYITRAMCTLHES